MTKHRVCPKCKEIEPDHFRQSDKEPWMYFCHWCGNWQVDGRGYWHLYRSGNAQNCRECIIYKNGKLVVDGKVPMSYCNFPKEPLPLHLRSGMFNLFPKELNLTSDDTCEDHPHCPREFTYGFYTERYTCLFREDRIEGKKRKGLQKISLVKDWQEKIKASKQILKDAIEIEKVIYRNFVPEEEEEKIKRRSKSLWDRKKFAELQVKAGEEKKETTT